MLELEFDEMVNVMTTSLVVVIYVGGVLALYYSVTLHMEDSD